MVYSDEDTVREQQEQITPLFTISPYFLFDEDFGRIHHIHPSSVVAGLALTEWRFINLLETEGTWWDIQMKVILYMLVLYTI